MKKVAKAVKRPRGRPRKEAGMLPVISGRVPKQLIDRVDQWAVANGITRSEALARLLEQALGGRKK